MNLTGQTERNYRCSFSALSRSLIRCSGFLNLTKCLYMSVFMKRRALTHGMSLLRLSLSTRFGFSSWEKFSHVFSSLSLFLCSHPTYGDGKDKVKLRFCPFITSPLLPPPQTGRSICPKRNCVCLLFLITSTGGEQRRRFVSISAHLAHLSSYPFRL